MNLFKSPPKAQLKGEWKPIILYKKEMFYYYLLSVLLILYTIITSFGIGSKGTVLLLLEYKSILLKFLPCMPNHIFILFTLITMIIYMIFILIIHELLHIVLFEGGVLSNKVYLYLNLKPISRIALVAHYKGCISRNRSLAVNIMPLLIITVLFYFSSFIFNHTFALILRYTAINNLILSIVDIIYSVKITRLPKNAIIYGGLWKAEE